MCFQSFIIPISLQGSATLSFLFLSRSRKIQIKNPRCCERREILTNPAGFSYTFAVKNLQQPKIIRAFLLKKKSSITQNKTFIDWKKTLDIQKIPWPCAGPCSGLRISAGSGHQKWVHHHMNQDGKKKLQKPNERTWTCTKPKAHSATHQRRWKGRGGCPRGTWPAPRTGRCPSGVRAAWPRCRTGAWWMLGGEGACRF